MWMYNVLNKCWYNVGSGVRVVELRCGGVDTSRRSSVRYYVWRDEWYIVPRGVRYDKCDIVWVPFNK